ncbi:metal ABC transporter permease [Dehalococcoidia bacterium]|nr:metal ABC transporter permease [Dehalococcoidia bacterium]
MIPSILQYDFMIRALIGGILAGGLAPILGTFLVLRRFSLIAETLAHVALLGLAVGVATSLYPTLTTFIAVTAAAVVIERLRATGKLPGDVALAVVLYATMAAAVVIINAARGFNVDLWGFLFGSILTLTTLDLWFLGILALVVIVTITVFYSELAMATFDDDLARVSGVRVDWLNLGLAILTAATVTLSMRILGVLLVGALIVVPFLIGQTLSSGLRRSMIIASLVGIMSTVLGLVLSFYAHASAGGSIVLSAVGFLVAAQLWQKFRLGRTR